MGGWVEQVEEDEAVRVRCCELGVGGWVGGWVGGFTCSSLKRRRPSELSCLSTWVCRSWSWMTGSTTCFLGWVGGWVDEEEEEIKAV